jgi:hypothetical protein
MALFLLVTRPGPTGISGKPRFAGIIDPFVWEMCARIPGLDGWERCTKIPLSSAVTDTEKAPLCAILKTTLSTLSGTQRGQSNHTRLLRKRGAMPIQYDGLRNITLVVLLDQLLLLP